MEAKILEGILHVTGEHDTGKTTFALESGAAPERICFFDDDVKGRATVNGLQRDGFKFGAYHDLIAIRDSKTELAYHEAVLRIVNAIKPEQFDVIIWDTWSHFATTCHPYVVKHPNKFRESWSPMGKIKGAQHWQEARRYEAGLLSFMATLAKQVVVITHLKDAYINDAKVPDKFIPNASKTLNRIPRLRVWLRQNPSGSPVPMALVLKRLDRKVVEDGVIRTVSVLPRKIVPLEDDRSLWDTIWRYWDNPDDQPATLPTTYELGILDNTLTVDQKHLLQQMIVHGLVQHEEEEIEVASNDGSIDPTPELARELAKNRVTPEQIAEQLGKPVVLINKWLSEN